MTRGTGTNVVQFKNVTLFDFGADVTFATSFVHQSCERTLRNGKYSAQRTLRCASTRAPVAQGRCPAG
jgi:hypothetical protein